MASQCRLFAGNCIALIFSEKLPFGVSILVMGYYGHVYDEYLLYLTTIKSQETRQTIMDTDHLGGIG